MPESMAERVNQTLINKLRCLYNENNQSVSWDKLLPMATRMYNESIHTSLGYSSIYLLMGLDTYCQFKEPLSHARQVAFNKSKEIHEMNKMHYDKRHKEYSFNVGDQVLVKNHYRKKLDPFLIGPYEVLQKLSDNSYVIDIPKKGRRNDIYHISQLKPCT